MQLQNVIHPLRSQSSVAKRRAWCRQGHGAEGWHGYQGGFLGAGAEPGLLRGQRDPALSGKPLMLKSVIIYRTVYSCLLVISQ